MTKNGSTTVYLDGYKCLSLGQYPLKEQQCTHLYRYIYLPQSAVPFKAVVTNWWVADPFSMGRQTLTGEKKCSEK